ncbi:MAG: phosphatase PAP2 family protein [Candidatus Heimdallarchaeota archaeon]
MSILFGFLDLQISLLLVNPQSKWAHWIADYGEIPGILMIITSLVILNRFQVSTRTKQNFLLSLGIFILTTIMIYVYVAMIGSNLGLSLVYEYYFPPIIVICVILIQLLLKKVNVSFFQDKLNFALITIFLAILNPLVIVGLIKRLWGRVRFKDLTPDHSNYTPWFIPQGINGHESFPSGHAAMGWMLLPLLLFTRKKSLKVQILVGGVIFVWGVIVAMGRIVIGAHYASDVLFSTCVAIVGYLILYKRIYYRPYLQKT